MIEGGSMFYQKLDIVAGAEPTTITHYYAPKYPSSNH
jgi:hypothetical protein